MSKVLRYGISALLLVLAVLTFAAGYSINDHLQSPLDIDEAGVDITLSRGDSLNSLAYQLQRRGVLRYPSLLLAYNRLYSDGQSVKAGDYFLPQGLTPKQLLQKLQRGDVKYYQLTLVEGWTLQQVLQSLRDNNKLQQRLPATNALQAMTPLLAGGGAMNSLEGMLFPDTYRFDGSTSDSDILRQAYEKLATVLSREWEGRAANLPYDNAYQALIMASLVEKETGEPSERATIAGVFVRRLQQGMRLQTDPTIIYGLGASFDGNLRRRHLKDSANLFNTYRHHGLPPSPIALAGLEAIRAALHPKPGLALYFVAKGDGSHYFSETLEQHRAAVQKYQVRQRRKDYSSAPKTPTKG